MKIRGFFLVISGKCYTFAKRLKTITNHETAKNH